MRQGTFCGARLGVVPHMVKKCAHAFLTILDANAPHLECVNVTSVWRRSSGHFASPPHLKSCQSGVFFPKKFHPTLCFYSLFYWGCNVYVTELSRERYELVRETLHACNTKKIFAKHFELAPMLSGSDACNVCLTASKLLENPVVSHAINHLFDCIVDDRNHPTTSPGWLGLADILTLFAAPAQQPTGIYPIAGGAR